MIEFLYIFVYSMTATLQGQLVLPSFEHSYFFFLLGTDRQIVLNINKMFNCLQDINKEFVIVCVKLLFPSFFVDFQKVALRG